MKTNKITTIEGEIQYYFFKNRLCFVIKKDVNKYNRTIWRTYAYEHNMINTNKYICNITRSDKTKKEAIENLLKAINSSPNGFYHNVI